MPGLTNAVWKLRDAVSPQQRRRLRRMADRMLSPVGSIVRGSADQPYCALTFDDGPDPRWTAPLLDLLAEHKVGALVVSSDGNTVDGIVSERDVVRRLQAIGPELLQAPVRDIMTSQVHSCPPDTDLEELMRVMTTGRFRHVPVIQRGRLVGIISIGDVVKHRIDELQSERDQLTAYIQG
jgi:hypothetical protein